MNRHSGSGGVVAVAKSGELRGKTVMSPGWAARALLAAVVGTVALGGLGGDASVALGQLPMPQMGGVGPDGKLAKVDDVVKDMQVIGGGLMTFYRHDEKDPAKDHTRLLCLIPRGLMDQDLMLAKSVSRGPDFGYPLDDGILVKWQQVGNRVMLVGPDSRLKDDGNKEIQGAVRATYRPALLAGFPILAVDGSGGVLIDLSNTVYSGLAGASMPPMSIRRDLSRITKVKSFPDNVLIDVDVAMGGGPAAGGSLETIGLSYSFRRLPAVGSYTPRLSDERVGYFTTVRQDWTTKYSERDNVVRYINRWNVKKQDPSLEMSPPEKPIVFILERNIPVQFRKAIADGILEWNKAFEKVGISNAVVVQQQTDDNEFKDVDPEDARYNFIRWIVTGRGFAMGPSRPDPRTGQLLDADIIFDDSMARFAAEEAAIFGPSSLASQFGSDVIEFFRDNPAFLPAGAELSDEDRELLRPVATEGGGVTIEREVKGPNGSTGHLPPGQRSPFGLNSAGRANRGIASHECSLGSGMRRQLAMLHVAAAAGKGKKLPDRLINQYLKEVTTHEVGHTLGLRHNFKASAWLSLEEIRKRRDTTDEPYTSSVMDYNPLMFFAGDKVGEIRNVVTPVIGPYDHWAIEYGYGAPATGKSEAEYVSSVASKSNQSDLAYASDEDVSYFAAPDPKVNLFDAGSDPIAMSKQRIALVDELMKNFREWAAEKDDPNYVLRDVFLTLMGQRASGIPVAARMVTGQVTSRSRSGDPSATPAFTIPDPKTQREAIKFLSETVFKEGFFDVDPELYNLLGVRRYYDWTGMPQTRTDFPVHSYVLSQQSMALAALTNPMALQRIYDAERKSKADDKFTAAELLKTTRDLIWGDLGSGSGSDAKPAISSYRRNLQQQYVQNMLSIAELRSSSSVSLDLQNMVRLTLRELSGKLGDAIKGKGGLDFASKAHLSEAKIRIDRVLDAPYVPASAGGGGIIIRMGQPSGASVIGQGDGQP